jgi:AraC-like DNA-binding protein
LCTHARQRQHVPHHRHITEVAVTVVWNSSSVAPDVRADALRETVREAVVRVELDLPERPEDVRAALSLTDVGRVQLCTVDAMPTTVHRTARLAREDAEPALFLTLQSGRTSMMVQHGRQTVLRPGDFAVYATTAPYSLLFDHGVHAHFFRFPLRDLALPETVVREVSARTFLADDPVAGLVATYLQRLATSPELRGLTVADALAQPTVELVRAALAGAAGDTAAAREPLHSTLAARVLEHVRLHLADPDLGAASIAAAHHVSVRHLYAVLARAGIGLGDRIRSDRLEACRRDLARDPGAAVGAVARRWGFVDASHFSRAFRAKYGMSPREWRALRRGR